jgi:enoyl-CoA hydratase/carnithine racemase
MTFRHLLVDTIGDITTVTLDRPEKRNALALDVMLELTEALREVGGSDALGVVIAANGPVFSAGHNFGDMAGASLDDARHLFEVCTDMMDTLQSIPQPVIARVHALATAAGCQLVASCDLAIAAESAGFAIPGGKGGLFCHTPLVAVARNIGRKRALEMAFTGDPIDAATAAEWGLINRAVPDDELDAAVGDLIGRATRGSARSKALGKRSFYEQVGLDQPQAYEIAIEAMASAAMIDDAQEGFAAFLQKRHPNFVQRHEVAGIP